MNVIAGDGVGEELEVEATQFGPGGLGSRFHVVVKEESPEEGHLAEGGEECP